MNDPRLELFVSDSRKRGVPDAETRKLLLAQGWTDADLDPLFPDLVFKKPVVASMEASVINETPTISVASGHTDERKEEEPFRQGLNSYVEPKVSFPEVSSAMEVSSIPVSEPASSSAIPSSLNSSPTPVIPIRPISSLLAQETPKESFVVAQPTNVNSIIGTPRTQSEKHIVRYALVGALIIIVGGGSVFAYVKNIWPFGSAPYANDTVLLKGLAKISQISTSNYDISFKFKGVKRAVDAKPFTYDKVAVEASLERTKPLYERDKDRFTLLSQMISQLQNLKYQKKLFPATLDALTASASMYGNDFYSKNKDLIKNSFMYVRNSIGDKYTLQVTFETDDAVQAIRKHSFEGSAMKEGVSISGMTVTFDEKLPYPYFYFLGVPPKPPVVEFLQSRDQLFSLLPKQVSLSTSLTGSADFVSSKPFEERSGSISINGDAELGDSTYSFGFDVRVSRGAGYVRINKLPSLPIISSFFDLTSIKGTWIKIDKDSQGISQSGIAPVDLRNAEETRRLGEILARAYARAIKIAEEEKIVRAVGSPIRDSVGGVNGYTYTFELNRANIITAYTRLVKEVSPFLEEMGKIKKPEGGYEPDPKAIEFLKSELFVSFFDDLQKNTKVLVSFTKDGFPLALRVSSRMIPLDESVKLKDTEYVADFAYIFTNINKPITVEEPKDFITFDQAAEKVTGESLSEARAKGKNASIKANLSSLRASAELYFDKTGNYGPAFAKASCPAESGGKSMFDSKDYFIPILKSLRESSPDTAEGVCASNAKSYAVVWKLIPVKPKNDSVNTVVSNSFCVDNSGKMAEAGVGSLNDAIILTPKGEYSCK